MKTTRRILILSVAIGSGHLKAGEALCQAFCGHFNGEAYHLDFMRYAFPGFSRLVEKSYFYSTKYFPLVYKWLYHLEDRKQSLLQICESRIATKKYTRLIDAYKPDAIIATHSFPAVVASQLHDRFPIPYTVVITDYVSHHIWVNPHTQLYFVAHQGMVDQLQEAGADRDKIRVTGIPVRPEFTRNFSREGLQQKLGLEPDLLTLLIMSGGNGVGPLTNVIRTLAGLREQIQFIAITGNNRGLYSKLQTIFANFHLKGRVLPFVDNIQEYMAVSDLLVSKAGGLTVAESLVMGLPMVIIRPTPGQEEGNTRFLEQSGAGIYLKKIGDLRKIVEGLIGQPTKLDRMRQNALRAAKPNAATTILTEVERLIKGV